MKRLALICALVAAPALGVAQEANPIIDDIRNAHILPRFEMLAVQSQRLSDVAAKDCSPTSLPLRSAYGSAFDAWVLASHLRFGPTEVDDRAFALAFWPDSRGATPRALAGLIEEKDPIATSPEQYREVSIAARGFYALEFLLYDDKLMKAGDPDYHCALVRTIAADIASTSAAIWEDWQDSYFETLTNTGPDAIYRNEEEVLQEMFKALSTGLQFTSDTRLGRPLGTFDKPRPARAEARRSGRSARQVALSLTVLKDLAARLATDDPDLVATLEEQFDASLGRVSSLRDPVFASVAEPQSRLKIEVLQQSVDLIRATVAQELGPTLGVAAGFNSLDGD